MLRLSLFCRTGDYHFDSCCTILIMLVICNQSSVWILPFCMRSCIKFCSVFGVMRDKERVMGMEMEAEREDVVLCNLEYSYRQAKRLFDYPSISYMCDPRSIFVTALLNIFLLALKNSRLKLRPCSFISLTTHTGTAK